MMIVNKTTKSPKRHQNFAFTLYIYIYLFIISSWVSGFSTNMLRDVHYITRKPKTEEKNNKKYLKITAP